MFNWTLGNNCLWNSNQIKQLSSIKTNLKMSSTVWTPYIFIGHGIEKRPDEGHKQEPASSGWFLWVRLRKLMIFLTTWHCPVFWEDNSSYNFSSRQLTHPFQESGLWHHKLNLAWSLGQQAGYKPGAWLRYQPTGLMKDIRLIDLSINLSLVMRGDRLDTHILANWYSVTVTHWVPFILYFVQNTRVSVRITSAVPALALIIIGQLSQT